MMTRARHNHRPRGFSLIEVLLAIFILGVGVISIAALFPAGIAQQRASVDDSLGPTIANNAISLLRTKLRREDFGTFEQFGVAPVDTPHYTIPGDFGWLRPAFIFDDDLTTPDLNESGAINIFSQGTAGAGWDATERAAGYPASSPVLVGIPYNTVRFDNPLTPAFDPAPPRILFSQTERYYPASTQNTTIDVGKPQYVWDCMFRRFQGKIMVAIFVYRVAQPGGGGALYTVAPNPANPALSPLPIALDFIDNVGTFQNTDVSYLGPWDTGGIDDDTTTLTDNSFVGGLDGGIAYNPDDHRHCWMESKQWLLDQNNNIHRVLGAEREDEDVANPVEVELVRAVASVPPSNVFSVGTGAGTSVTDVVTEVWYIPVSHTDIDGNPLTLTPVYVTVKEL
jgi:prepilin-type N-terminal cleavage/methylation domain-containing protein